MLRRIWVVSIICVAPGAFAAPVPPEDVQAKLARSYGVWTSSERDCKFVLKGGELRIGLPGDDRLLGTPHERARDNAPRLLREVDGDFTTIIRVSVPVLERAARAFGVYRSGGLVAWEVNRDYFVVRRCVGSVNGNREAVWAHQLKGEVETDWIQRLSKPEDAVFLRLAREGKKVVAGWSRDGKVWKDFGATEVAWGAKVKVGVVAENCLGQPTEITFDQYSLTLPKK